LICAAQFGNSVDERAAAKTLTGDAPLQNIERTENLFGGRLVGLWQLRETASQIG